MLADAGRTATPRGHRAPHRKGWPQAEGIELTEAARVWGKCRRARVFIEENGLRFGIDLAEGQKTGFYLDQRENRRAAAGYLRGRRVLDMFCYSGGFALNARRRSAEPARCWAFDSSQKAVALAKANAELNDVRTSSSKSATASKSLDALMADARAGLAA